MSSIQVAPFERRNNDDEVKKLKLEVAHWRRLALTDDLTGLYHRRAGSLIVGKLMAWKTAFILFNMDLNEFKPINDQAGHAVGDLVLQALAGSLRAQADYVIRQGGDEFIAIVRCQPAEAMGIYYRLKSAAASVNLDSHLPPEMRGHRCGVAIGWASSDEGSGLPELLEISDRRMYTDKAAHKALAASWHQPAPAQMLAERV